MVTRFLRLRRAMGAAAFTTALILITWLPLGILKVVRFALEFPGESSLRLHTAAAILSLLVAAWGYWEND